MADLLPSLSSSEEDNGAAQQSEDSSSEEDEEELNKAFEFGGILGEDGIVASGAKQSLQLLDKPDVVPRMNIADIIAAKRKTLKEEQDGGDGSGGSQSGSDVDGDDSSTAASSSSDEEEHKDMETDVLKMRSEQVEEPASSDDDEAEAAKAAAFFEKNTSNNSSFATFNELTLCRPILRGVASMGYVTPTPIQNSVIPTILQGRDVCASAVTGSGKTAAFLLPMLEIIMHKYGTGSKALVLTPTRELAVQCLSHFETLAQFTKLTAVCIVGGVKNTKTQSAELRNRPDLVIATPGRLLDHVLNTPGFTLDELSVLCLDEADRLLDLGFQDEIHEILRHCPENRQTLLFSATMNTKIDDLIRLSLKHPVRIRISEENSKDLTVAPRLEQEFIRIRASNEGVNREAMLLALLKRTFSDNVICFFDTKLTAHRLMILCGLLGISCTELHGNLTQQQRLDALQAFKDKTVQVLLATDLAARGLDISSVQTVINFEMPAQMETYIHRIGRTARAGRSGCSCTLIGEGRRHLMKELLKRNQNGVVRSRTIPQSVVAHFAAKIESLEESVEEILQAEAVARMDRIAEMEAIKAQNIIEHSGEIQARPQREWFASNSQKQRIKELAAEKKKRIEDAVGTGTHRMNRKKRRKRDALAALDQPSDDGDDDQEDAPPRKQPSVKSDARKQKRATAELQQAKTKQGLYDEDVEAKQKKKKKKLSSGTALGDGSLFSEDKVLHSTNSATTIAPKSSFQFRGHDPDKHTGKKPKTKGHKAFKSKAKYRGRKRK